MRRVLFPVLIAIYLVLALPGSARAQNGQATLMNRALLDAKQTWSGPQAGAAFGGKTINGITFPRGYQPVASFSAIFPTQDWDIWQVLSTGNFGRPQDSKDYLLTIQAVNLNWESGKASVSDTIILSDPKKKLKTIVNGTTSTRYLTGADFKPLAFVQLADASFWVAEGVGPSLLHFRDNGQLMDAPTALSGAGALQGMGLLPNGTTLLIAQRGDGSNVVFRTLDLTAAKKQISQPVTTYLLGDASHSVSSVMVIDQNRALVIEQDAKQGADARFKMIFLVDMSANPAAKTPLVDLLNIADPNGIATSKRFAQQPANAFGLSSPFKFPYVDVSAVYPIDDKTLLVVNNNHLPDGTGRSANLADDSEFIAVQIP